MAKKIVRTYADLNVYTRSYELAMEIYVYTKQFPKEETYALSDQLRRASRSIPANIAEGWAKRKYQNVFIRHLNDANGSCEETKTWLRFALDCQYLEQDLFEKLLRGYNDVGAMLNALMKRWKTYD
ncbi:MAG: four helix bundle protein [Candidatus Omnitrophica bacterium]|nr:four helix bundle protein [Candidatus Omnitrophota bacterium]MDD5671814.1 four helix bundle protein [Candidatus Omnitrophota bacterium]